MRGILVSVAAWMLLACPASAAQMVAIFQGVTIEDADTPADLPFKGIFAYDTKLGRDEGGSHYIGRAGGWAVDDPILCPNNCPGPFTSITLIIDGVTSYYGQGYYDDVGVMPGSAFFVHPESNWADIQMVFFTADAPANLTTPFVGLGSGYGTLGPNSSRPTFSFDLTSLRVSAVPEPSTWGLMIIGFGLAGVTLRRRRAQAVGSHA